MHGEGKIRRAGGGQKIVLPVGKERNVHLRNYISWRGREVINHEGIK